MNERKELFRLMHIALAIAAPILFIALFLVKDASEAVRQTVATLGILLPFAIFFALDEHSKRRRRRNQ
jgi:uncharacterized membrane protein YdjX (TVP38/TMEM64 family)